jgi:hypothetical protein
LETVAADLFQLDHLRLMRFSPPRPWIPLTVLAFGSVIYRHHASASHQSFLPQRLGMAPFGKCSKLAIAAVAGSKCWLEPQPEEAVLTIGFGIIGCGMISPVPLAAIGDIKGQKPSPATAPAASRISSRRTAVHRITRLDKLLADPPSIMPVLHPSGAFCWSPAPSGGESALSSARSRSTSP